MKVGRSEWRHEIGELIFDEDNLRDAVEYMNDNNLTPFTEPVPRYKEEGMTIELYYDPHQEPSAEACSEGQYLGIDPESKSPMYATWYPQMGGYVAKCIIAMHENGCFDAFIWHNGEFPFTDEPPECLHHCSGEQFVEFGKFVLSKQGGTEE